MAASKVHITFTIGTYADQTTREVRLHPYDRAGFEEIRAEIIDLLDDHTPGSAALPGTPTTPVEEPPVTVDFGLRR